MKMYSPTFKIKLFIILIIFIFIDIRLIIAQSNPSNKESIDWINDKLKTYSASIISIQKIKIEEIGSTEPAIIFTLYDARGNEEVTFLTKMSINIEFIEKISIRKENDFIAIDITPKPNRSCVVISSDFWGKNFNYGFAKEFIEADKFSILDFDYLPFIQLSLKKSADNDAIPERIVKALKNILQNYGITLNEEIF